MPSSWRWTSFTDQAVTPGELPAVPSINGASSVDSVGFAVPDSGGAGGTIDAIDGQDVATIAGAVALSGTVAAVDAPDISAATANIVGAGEMMRVV